MTATRSVAAILAGALALGWVSHASTAGDPTRQQQPAFRATGDLVSVDVSVLAGGKAVDGLTPDDFVVLDNGVRQRVQSIEPVAMPVDVTLVADVSADSRGVWANGFSFEATRARVTEDVQFIAALLRPDDRLRLIAIDTYVQQGFPFGPPAAARVGPLELGGPSSTYDALVAAMSGVGQPNRRHLVIAWVKALDSMSATDAQTVRDVARRTDTVVHVIQRATARFGRVPAPSPDATSIEILRRTWHPFRRQDPTLLTEIAQMTGGTYDDQWGLRDASVADTFKEIFETFRKGQVLHYAPQGVVREGAHEIAVTVPRFPSADIRARRSYFIEGASGAATTAGGARAPALTPRAATLAGLVTAFDRGHDAFAAAARQTTDLRGVFREYMDQRPLAASRSRAGVFALELSTLGVGSTDDNVRSEALDLLLNFHTLVRHPIDADAFECRWYAAEVTALSIGLNTGAAERAATHALERCPSDGAITLARAIAADQFWSTDTGREHGTDALRRDVTGSAVVMRRYGEAMAFPAAAFEARVRAAWLAFRMGNLETAAARLNETAASSDRVLVYFRNLVRGQVLREQGQHESAAQAFRDALAVWPAAQSARVSLMSSLVRLGQRREALELAERIQTEPSSAVDPWWLYWQGRYYAWPAIVGQLMESAP